MGLVKELGKAVAPFVLAGSILLGGCGSQPPQPRKLEQRISQEVAQSNNKADKYAVLISGNIETRDMYDLSMTYQVLLENGFQKDNIYILDKDGEKTPLYPVDDVSSKVAIDTLFDYLGKKVDSQDLLFVYLTDHGDRENYSEKDAKGDEKTIEISKVILPGEDMNEIEFKKVLDKVHSKNTIVLADICYGGGFANRLSNGNYVGISSSLENKQAHGDTQNMFSRHFMDSYRNPSESDKNRDGVIDLRESFDYATQKHPWTRDGDDTPLLKSELDLEKITLQ